MPPHLHGRVPRALLLARTAVTKLRITLRSNWPRHSQTFPNHLWILLHHSATLIPLVPTSNWRDKKAVYYDICHFKKNPKKQEENPHSLSLEIPTPFSCPDVHCLVRELQSKSAGANSSAFPLAESMAPMGYTRLTQLFRACDAFLYTSKQILQRFKARSQQSRQGCYPVRRCLFQWRLGLAGTPCPGSRPAFWAAGAVQRPPQPRSPPAAVRHRRRQMAPTAPPARRPLYSPAGSCRGFAFWVKNGVPSDWGQLTLVSYLGILFFLQFRLLE